MTAETFTVNVLDRPDHEAAAEFSWGDKTYTIETSANVTLRNTATAWLPPATIMAMKKDLPLHIDSTVDPKTLEGTNEAQQLLHSWWPEELHKISIEASTEPNQTANGRGIGCFFSGGLDSFYSAITNDHTVTHLIFVHGFDIYLNSTAHYRNALKHIRTIATEMNKTLIEVTTSIKTPFVSGRNWMHAHGAAMAHVAFLLSDHIHTALIPASHHRDNLIPHGSHPELDPLWSSQAVTLVYDNFEATRTEKAKAILGTPAAMHHLRVCSWNRSDVQNCGECEKCVRTALNMKAAGAGESFTAIPQTNIPRAIRHIKYTTPNQIYFLRENICALTNLPEADEDILNELKLALDRSPMQRAIAAFWSSITSTKMALILIYQKLTPSP
ncbi:hypothetical protein [Tomitella gaofuii]|uniref:hypothetical protein n=1 Tax=Tomitella gaofuii TaxID=2760083 RepID=UPI0015FAC73C|nr:hypothetical protein [Tomitella gaofuii]